MPEELRDSIDRSDTQYENVLLESIAVQLSAEARTRMVLPVSADERREIARQVNDLLQRRVGLLRRTVDLPTIEEAFPRVRTRSDETEVGLDTQAILEAFASNSTRTPRFAARAMQRPPRPEALTQEEWDAFSHARNALAKELGYHTGYDDTDDGDEELSKWFVIRRGDLTFEMEHFAFASAPAILGRSRIASLRVTSSTSNSVVEHLAFDRVWTTFCTDAAVQREVDRVVAIFA